MNETERVKLKVGKVWGGSVHPRDSVVLVPVDVARRWIAAGEAEPVSTETPTPKKKSE